MAQVHGFAVGALGGNAGQACFSEANGVFRYRLYVDIFGFWREEGDRWNIDSWLQCALLPICVAVHAVAISLGHFARKICVGNRKTMKVSMMLV